MTTRGKVKMLQWLAAHRALAPVAFAALFLGLVTLGVVLIHRRDSALGAAMAAVARLRADSARAARVVRATDSVYVVDTLRLTRVRTQYHVMHDSVRSRVTDTLVVDRFVTVADSTVRACVYALRSCERRVAARDSLIRVLSDQRSADRQLYRARLAAASPRIQFAAAVAANPFGTNTVAALAGVEMRLVGAVSLTLGGSYQSFDSRTHVAPAVGARMVFR